jgi:hypothetical protein
MHLLEVDGVIRVWLGVEVGVNLPQKGQLECRGGPRTGLNCM